MFRNLKADASTPRDFPTCLIIWVLSAVFLFVVVNGGIFEARESRTAYEDDRI
jgi:hypothetical protein